MRDRRLLFLLIIVFVGLAGVALLQQAPQPAAQTVGGTPAASTEMEATVTAWRGTFLFPDLTVREIVTVNLRDPNNGDTFTISRAGDGTWTAPGSEGILDVEAARAIAQTIVLIPVEREIPMSEDADLTEFGFDPNGVMFVEFLEQNENSHVMALGGLTTDRQYYYMVVDDRPVIYLSPRGPLDFLRQMLSSPPLT